MTSQPGKQTIAIQILPNISRSKGNQTIKFGICCKDFSNVSDHFTTLRSKGLMQYNMRNIFREKSYAKCCGGNISRPFSKKS